MLPPLYFQPLIKRLRWGGTRLGTQLGKAIATATDAAESWEIVDHGADQSLVVSGSFAGWTLQQLVAQHGTELFGEQPVQDRFPLLIKFLDAHDLLSVQVHPNNVQAALRHPGELGKTEAWVILEAAPEAKVYAGLKPGVDRQQLAAAIAAGTCETCLHALTVKPGDVVYIPAGTVHALGEGILLAEIQQASDLTYRLYDWGRLGTDGQPRTLHIPEALECIDFARGPIPLITPQPSEWPGVERAEELIACPEFIVRRFQWHCCFQLPEHSGFRIVQQIAGACVIRTATGNVQLQRGQTALIPACAGTIRLEALQPGATCLETRLP